MPTFPELKLLKPSDIKEAACLLLGISGAFQFNVLGSVRRHSKAVMQISTVCLEISALLPKIREPMHTSTQPYAIINCSKSQLRAPIHQHKT